MAVHSQISSDRAIAEREENKVQNTKTESDSLRANAVKQAQLTGQFVDSDGVSYDKGAKGYLNDTESFESTASTEESNAETSANSAATSESNAQTSANNASDYKNDAEKQAYNVDNFTETDGDTYNKGAKGYMEALRDRYNPKGFPEGTRILWHTYMDRPQGWYPTYYDNIQSFMEILQNVDSTHPLGVWMTTAQNPVDDTFDTQIIYHRFKSAQNPVDDTFDTAIIYYRFESAQNPVDDTFDTDIEYQ